MSLASLCPWLTRGPVKAMGQVNTYCLPSAHAYPPRGARTRFTTPKMAIVHLALPVDVFSYIFPSSGTWEGSASLS